MLTYSFNKRPVRMAIGRSKKQQINKNKNNAEDEIVANTSEINNTKSKVSLKTTRKYEEEVELTDEMILQIRMEKQRKTPKSWKDTWQRPLNESIIMEDSDTFSLNKSKSSNHHKIRTDTRSKRRDNEKNSYLSDMIFYEELK